MSYTALPAGNIAANKGIIHSLWTLIKSNFTDHQSRINTLESTPGAKVGTIIFYGNVSVPTGWLKCDGSVLSQATYGDLYAIIGSTYNVGGEIAGSFRLPDYRSRVIVGVGAGSGLTSRAMADSGGAETHTLSTSEIASHTHTTADPGHYHTTDTAEYYTGSDLHSPTDWSQNGGSSTSSDTGVNSTASATTGVTTQNRGGGGAHANVQPCLGLNFIIKY